MSSVEFVPISVTAPGFNQFKGFTLTHWFSHTQQRFIIILFFLFKSSFLTTLCFGPFREHSFTRRLRTCAASNPFPDWLTESVVVSRGTRAAEQSCLWLSAGAVRLTFNNLPSVIWLFPHLALQKWSYFLAIWIEAIWSGKLFMFK